MGTLISSTKDLANVVYKKLQGAKISHTLPEKKILEKLFESLFYVSIKTEESDFIKVTVTLISANNPDPNPPKRIVKDRWNYIYFDEPIPFNIKNITKLSKAADPWSSSLAVDFNTTGEIFIWGLIDQSVHYQSYLHYEARSGPEQPGIFQTSITGIGEIDVIFDYELIASLKQHSLIDNYLDVFRRGEVSKILKNNTKNYEEEIVSYIKKELPKESIRYWKTDLYNIWIETFSRILIRAQNYQHGGAFLITNDFGLDLDIKYKINYDRLYSSVCNHAKLTILNSFYSEVIQDNYYDEELMPVDLYLEESIAIFEKDETIDEIKGAVRFIASLSCIDGLVVFSPEFKVKGFGGVIKNITLPEFIFLSKSSQINNKKLIPVNPNHYGTRHRSMFSYCWKHEGCIGFVISQDGDIRVITKIVDKLIMWENIKVKQLIRSHKLKRTIKAITK